MGYLEVSDRSIQWMICSSYEIISDNGKKQISIEQILANVEAIFQMEIDISLVESVIEKYKKGAIEKISGSNPFIHENPSKAIYQ